MLSLIAMIVIFPIAILLIGVIAMSLSQSINRNVSIYR